MEQFLITCHPAKIIAQDVLYNVPLTFKDKYINIIISTNNRTKLNLNYPQHPLQNDLNNYTYKNAMFYFNVNWFPSSFL